MKYIIIALLSYLIGCFSSAFFLGKAFKKIDIRLHGSGNSGATNALRVMGAKIGVLTFVLDFIKGILGVLIGFLFQGFTGGLVGGLFAVVGHNWPVFLNFKGGKGVATTLGALAVLSFPTALISISIGIIVALISKYVSLGSIVFLSSTPLISSLIVKPFNKQLLIATLIFASVGVFRHKSNIDRLIKGNENRIHIGR